MAQNLTENLFTFVNYTAFFVYFYIINLHFNGGKIRKSTNFVAISNFSAILSERDLFSFIEICGFYL